MFCENFEWRNFRNGKTWNGKQQSANRVVSSWIRSSRVISALSWVSWRKFKFFDSNWYRVLKDNVIVANSRQLVFYGEILATPLLKLKSVARFAKRSNCSNFTCNKTSLLLRPHLANWYKTGIMVFVTPMVQLKKSIMKTCWKLDMKCEDIMLLGKLGLVIPTSKMCKVNCEWLLWSQTLQWNLIIWNCVQTQLGKSFV